MQFAGHTPDTPFPRGGPIDSLATDYSRAEAEIESLKAQLLEARKQATLGELLGTTTHEFNNALTTILNYARLGIRHPDK